MGKYACCVIAWRSRTAEGLRLAQAPRPATPSWRWRTRRPTCRRHGAGRLDARAQREIGFPWSEAMVERSRRSVGASIQATCVACARAWRPTWRAARTTPAPTSRQRLLRVQRHRRGRAPHAGRAHGWRPAGAALRGRGDRPGRAPGQRHGHIFAATPACSRCRCMARRTFRFARRRATWTWGCPTAAVTRPTCTRWIWRWTSWQPLSPRPGVSTWPVPTRTRATAWGA
jgi:hypothetical protein